MLNVAVLMDPIEKLTLQYDTSVRLLEEMGKRNWNTYLIYPNEVYLENGRSYVILTPVKTDRSSKIPFHKEASMRKPSSFLHALWMRKDPPFTIEYIDTTYLLDFIESQGTRVLNSSFSLRNCNEKIFCTRFPQWMAPTLLTNHRDVFFDFLKKQSRVVLKPLDLMGGRGIEQATINNESEALRLFDEMTLSHTKLIMVQKFLDEVYTDGDRRILMVDGEPYPVVLVRKPKEGTFKANMASGGRISPGEMTAREIEICSQLGPILRNQGIFFAGLDIIGGHLSEVNITSPTGLVALEEVTGHNIADFVLTRFAKGLREPSV